MSDVKEGSVAKDPGRLTEMIYSSAVSAASILAKNSAAGCTRGIHKEASGH